MMGALDSALPEEIKRRALTLPSDSVSPRSELVLPFAEALRAIGIASEQQIAVLGVEGFEVREDGLLTVAMADASSYVRDAGDWKSYVAQLNAEAERWIRENPLGENHGYILTSASREEFGRLRL
jgi:hypothetical protein